MLCHCAYRGLSRLVKGVDISERIWILFTIGLNTFVKYQSIQQIGVKSNIQVLLVPNYRAFRITVIYVII